MVAEETREDGVAMKTIAALTMVFLPGSFLASVFGMPMLDGAKWSLFVAIAVPMTIGVVGCWWLWLSLPQLLRRFTRERHTKSEEKMV
jgi:Na+/melibiose symporter-like transporter